MVECLFSFLPLLIATPTCVVSNPYVALLIHTLHDFWRLTRRSVSSFPPFASFLGFFAGGISFWKFPEISLFSLLTARSSSLNQKNDATFFPWLVTPLGFSQVAFYFNASDMRTVWNPIPTGGGCSLGRFFVLSKFDGPSAPEIPWSGRRGSSFFFFPPESSPGSLCPFRCGPSFFPLLFLDREGPHQKIRITPPHCWRIGSFFFCRGGPE